jgi:hypothetical protein
LPSVQERGIAHAIGTLEFGDGNPKGLAQTIERIAGLDDVGGDPGTRRAARDRGLGGHGRYVEDYPGKQLRRQQAVGLLELGAADPVACCQIVQRITGLDDVRQPAGRRRTICRRRGQTGSPGGR